MKSQFVKKIIDDLKVIIKDHERDIRCDFKFRNHIPWNGYGEVHSSTEYKAAERAIIRNWIKCLREAREALDGIKKQMPMPVKVTVIKTKFEKHEVALGFFFPAVFDIDKHYQCPKCQKVVSEDLSYHIDKGDRPNYCPHCGQKLWWSK